MLPRGDSCLENSNEKSSAEKLAERSAESNACINEPVPPTMKDIMIHVRAIPPAMKIRENFSVSIRALMFVGAGTFPQAVLGFLASKLWQSIPNEKRRVLC
jgi:hypothetical protein